MRPERCWPLVECFYGGPTCLVVIVAVAVSRNDDSVTSCSATGHVCPMKCTHALALVRGPARRHLISLLSPNLPIAAAVP